MRPIATQGRSYRGTRTPVGAALRRDGLQSSPRISEASTSPGSFPGQVRSTRDIYVTPHFPRHTRLRADAGLHLGVPQPDRADTAGRHVRACRAAYLGAVLEHHQCTAGDRRAQAEFRHRPVRRHHQRSDRHPAGLGAGALHLPRAQDHRCDDRPAVRPAHGCSRYRPDRPVRALGLGRPVRHRPGLQDRLHPTGHHPGADLRHPAVRGAYGAAGAGRHSA
uniref:Sulfate ABC transporter n=1 Tax=Pseudomonas putida TaxID=303 RepID=B9U2M3_PSEPU|nr:sulfate ABC transporter [Pseudomonas putida]